MLTFLIQMIYRGKQMHIIPIDKKNVSAEILAKITNSMVKPFGCRATYDKLTGQIELSGGESCKAIAIEVVDNLIKIK